MAIRYATEKKALLALGHDKTSGFLLCLQVLSSWHFNFLTHFPGPWLCLQLWGTQRGQHGVLFFGSELEKTQRF